MDILPAGLSLSESMRNTSLVSEVVNISIDLDKSESVSIALIGADLGVRAGILELLSAFPLLQF